VHAPMHESCFALWAVHAPMHESCFALWAVHATTPESEKYASTILFYSSSSPLFFWVAHAILR